MSHLPWTEHRLDKAAALREAYGGGTSPDYSARHADETRRAFVVDGYWPDDFPSRADHGFRCCPACQPADYADGHARHRNNGDYPGGSEEVEVRGPLNRLREWSAKAYAADEAAHYTEAYGDDRTASKWRTMAEGLDS